MLAQLVFTAVNCSSGTCAVPAQTVVTVPAPQIVVSSPQIITTPVVVSSMPVESTVNYKRGLFGRLKPVSATVKTGATCSTCR